MKNEKQIVLFLKSNTTFNQTQIAAKMTEKFSELGSPIILPPNENDTNQPLIIFNQGIMNVTINYNDVSMVFFEDNKDSCNELIVDLIDFFTDYSFDFVRMGYISTFLNGKKERENFKKKMFAEENVINDDFQLAWYSKESIDSVLVNVWERYFTDFNQNIDLVSIFDINTPIDEEYNISSDFVGNFLKKCDKFIENKLKDRI